MEDWDKPFLLRCNFLWEGKISEEEYRREMEVRKFRCDRICNLLRHDFRDERMVFLLGSVISSLPEEVFLHLVEIPNLYFHHVDRRGSVQTITPPHPDKSVFLVEFQTHGLSDSMITGLMCHEIAHLHLGHHRDLPDGLHLAEERAADEQAEAWGFKYELDLLREHLKKEKGEN